MIDIDWHKQLVRRQAKLGMKQIDISMESGVCMTTVFRALHRGSVTLRNLRKIADCMNLVIVYVDEHGDEVDDLAYYRKNILNKTVTELSYVCKASYYTIEQVIWGNNVSTYSIEEVLKSMGLRMILVDESYKNI